MPYDAITIDTNTVIQEGMRLEAMPLTLLNQFKGAPTAFILSDVVEQEIEAKLIAQTAKSRNAALTALASLPQLGLVSDADLEIQKAVIAAITDAKTAAKKRLGAFKEACGAERVPTGLTAIEEVMERYFEATAPFEPTGDKKHEFPDAVALMSIQKWAEFQNRRVLAVSSDKGWAEFAKTSDHIDVEADLLKALGRVQTHTENAERTIQNLLEALDEGKFPEIWDSLEIMLRNSMREWDWDVEANSAFYHELESSTMELHNFGLKRGGEQEYEFAIVRMGSNMTVFQLEIQIGAEAKADFSLAKWDSIDRDYVGMGHTSAAQEVDFAASILVSIGGDINGEISELEVWEVEVVEGLNCVEFGEISPSYGDEDWNVA